MAKLRLTEFGRPSEMLAALGDWLEEDAATNNMVLGLLYRMVRREQAGHYVEAILVGVWRDEEPLMALLQAPPRELMMVCGKEHWERAMVVVAGHFKHRHPGLLGLVGPDPQAAAFAEGYAGSYHRVFSQKVMRLDRLVPAKPVLGGVRQALPEDLGTMQGWLVDFFMESLRKELSLEDAATLAKGKIIEKSMWMWVVEGEAVCMAGVERPTRYGITVVLVYTPVPHRGRGYASNLVAFITDLQLRLGRKFLCLHTDADYEQSNRVYRALGYYDVGRGSILHFRTDPEG